MVDIRKIIEAMDSEIIATGQEFLTPSEANAMLEQRGLLRNSKHRPGLPLRRLCRERRIPHAFQTGGKGSAWRIPHSKSNPVDVTNVVPDNQDKTETDRPSNDMADIERKVKEAREKYKPDEIRILLVAEAPPDKLDRFFYYPDVKTADWLFLGIMQVLYPTEKQDYLVGRRDLVDRRETRLKEKLLDRFKNDGFYLVDLLNHPLAKHSGNLASTKDEFLARVSSLITNNTRVILIKASVYDLAHRWLVENGFKNVIDKRIHFPASGGQIKFRIQFKEALELAGYP